MFLGHWTCKGQVAASPMRPAHSSETDVDIAKALDGYRPSLHLQEKKTADNPHPFEGVSHWGYDPGRKLFVEHWVDSSGAYSEQTSAGWNGDTIVFAGDLLGGEVQLDGEWRTTVKDTCKHVTR